jgi:hypothetical protein
MKRSFVQIIRILLISCIFTSSFSSFQNPINLLCKPFLADNYTGLVPFTDWFGMEIAIERCRDGIAQADQEGGEALTLPYGRIRTECVIIRSTTGFLVFCCPLLAERRASAASGRQSNYG